MSTYEQGDYIKVEIVDHVSRESEWIWVHVEHCYDVNRIVFGRLDNVPIVSTDIKVGQELAISYDNVRGRRKQSDFKQEHVPIAEGDQNELGAKISA